MQLLMNIWTVKGGETISLCINNLKEPSEQTPVERSKLDSVKLAHLFQTEFRIGDFELSKCICLGKVSQTRPRPVLITIKNVYISPDMTAKEREEAKQLRAELRRRRSEGEHNLVIQRGKIITVTHNPPQSSNTTTSKWLNPRRIDNGKKLSVFYMNVDQACIK